MEKSQLPGESSPGYGFFPGLFRVNRGPGDFLAKPVAYGQSAPDSNKPNTFNGFGLLIGKNDHLPAMRYSSEPVK
jgi:hypothetical protein